jgi:ABC-type multidrug transport system fused ATPase/permease subunit
MNDRSLKRLFTLYVVSITFSIIQTLLAGLSFYFLTSAYNDGLFPSSPLIKNVIQIVVAVLLFLMIAFVCAMYIIIEWSAVSEVRARNRHFELNYEQRKREFEQRLHHLEQQRQLPRQRETVPPIPRRVSANLRPGTTPLRASRPRRVDTYRTYRRE